MMPDCSCKYLPKTQSDEKDSQVYEPQKAIEDTRGRTTGQYLMEGGVIDDFILQNGYPAGVVNYNINDVLNRRQNKPKNPTTTVPKKGNNLSSTLFRGTKY